MTALGIAGLVSAKNSVETLKNKEEKRENKSEEETKKLVDNCYTITYVLSCGDIGDSYCTSWPKSCIPKQHALLEEVICH